VYTVIALTVVSGAMLVARVASELNTGSNSMLAPASAAATIVVNTMCCLGENIPGSNTAPAETPTRDSSNPSGLSSVITAAMGAAIRMATTSTAAGVYARARFKIYALAIPTALTAEMMKIGVRHGLTGSITSGSAVIPKVSASTERVSVSDESN
jgi:hypothetical protein